MYKLKKVEVSASEIAGLVNRALEGEDILVRTPSSLEEPQEYSFMCIDKEMKLSLEKLMYLKNVLIITDADLREGAGNCSIIRTETPKMDFLRAIYDFFITPDEIRVAESAKIHPHAQIGRNVTIGENVIIGADVVVGDYTQILHNTVIVNQVVIGKNCIIKHNATIGSEGFDFEIDKFGIPVHYPHVGRIKIGNNVWIGSNSCVESGKISDTQIRDDVKVDDLVQIGYNCSIGSQSLITAGSVIGRNVVIGSNCLVSPNSVIRQNIRVGDDVIIGEGSVVIRDLEAKTVYVGNPARFLRIREDK